MSSAIFQNKMLIHKLNIYVLVYMRKKTLGLDIEVQKKHIAEAFTFSQDGITGTRFDLLPEHFFFKDKI